MVPFQCFRDFATNWIFKKSKGPPFTISGIVRFIKRIFFNLNLSMNQHAKSEFCLFLRPSFFRHNATFFQFGFIEAPSTFTRNETFCEHRGHLGFLCDFLRKKKIRMLSSKNVFFQLGKKWFPSLIECNGTLWYSKISRFCNFDMFRNFVKNSKSMCDVALSMRLLFSLFSPFSMQNEDRARPSENAENEKA